MKTRNRRRRLVGRAILVALLLAIVWGFAERRRLLVHAMSTQSAPGLLDAVEEGPGVRWVDDYYTVERLDERTFAIGEPRYYQQNFNYLILGSERALLFDAGPGVRDIRPIAELLTDLPITFVPSHFHYDHVGNGIPFSRTAVIDLPELRARVEAGELTLTSTEHLGFAEGFPPRTLHVTEWLEPGGEISLGDRKLRVIHTPGHTPDSISLLDESRGYLFSGDFIYPGPLFAFLPGSRLGDYRLGSTAIEAYVPGEIRVFGAHRMAPPGVPELGSSDLRDLKTALDEIEAGARDGEGVYPTSYRVNDRIQLLAEPPWLQSW